MKKQLTLLCCLAAALWATGCGGGGKFSQQQPTSQTAAPAPSSASPAPTSASATPQSDTQGVSVTLQAPAVSATSPVPVQATADSSKGVSGWVVYSDDAPVYQATTTSTSLSTQVNLSSGSHVVYARAWDPTGAQGTSQPMTVQVGSGSTAATAAQTATSALPTPPANAVVLDNLQSQSDGWKACSDCAWGTNKTTNFWMAPFNTNPSRSGSSRELFVGGPQWTNALFIKTLPAHNDASHFLWDFWVYFDPTSNANIWSAEFDLWQQVGGTQFMIGSQCNFGNGEWDIWNEPANRWVPTDKPCPRWTPATWHHVQWYLERGSNYYRYVTVVLDGKPINFGVTYNTVGNSWADSVGVQWQLDQSGSGVALHEWIDNVKLTMW